MTPAQRATPATETPSGANADIDSDTELTFDEHEGRPDEILTAVAEAVALLEGYVRLRHALRYSDRYADRERRDMAVLASDHLHAAAYATIADAPVPDQRTLALYRRLTAGSSALAAGFAAWTPGDAEHGDDTDAAARDSSLIDESAHPRAVLAETAATLGTTAVGAADDTRAAMTTYARSLSTALYLVMESASRPASGAAFASPTAVSDDGIETGDDPRETAARVLSGRSTASLRSDASLGASPAIARHLERARDALTSLANRPETGSADERPVDGASDADATGTESETVPTTFAPLTRLERATRMPFEDE